MSISVEKKRTYDQEYYSRNREKKCKYAKEFRASRTPEEREKNLSYNRKYNKEHAQEKAAQNRKYIERRKAWLLDYKKTHPCEECGEAHPACIDFHHLNPENKKFAISDNGRGKCLETLKKEIAKCRPLCANCHRKFEWEENK